MSTTNPTPVQLTTDEIATFYRMQSLFATTLAVGQTLTGYQIAVLDYLTISFPRMMPLGYLDQQQVRAIRAKINTSMGGPDPGPLTQ